MTAPRCAVAIVGMAGRFPGAPNVAAFWRNLCDGVETIRRFDQAELRDDVDASVRAGESYVRARATLADADLFDAEFFGIHAADAERIDPQHRLLLECCWEALEDAGYDPSTYPGAIGVYAGCSINTYFLNNVLGDRSAIDRFTSDYPVGSYAELLGGGQDFLATRVAYKLGLRGPAITMQSACSTSLLTVAQACQALMTGQADMMLAGGVSISFPQERGYVHQSGGMASADGHCRTFDAQASGTVFGDGVGVVLLKRLDDALADGDTICAVVRGFGVNNDGSEKVGYTAPSSTGQAAAIATALEMSGFDPATIGFVECHGTATPLGDPIEVAALKSAFAVDGSARWCALGSVKPNVGHLDVAAGVTGLIKTALALKHATVPPTLNYTAPNPELGLESSPFYVNAQLAQWPLAGQTRRAAVSAFGLGGTNVHLALESAPETVRDATAGDCPQLLVLSARTESALADARVRLAAHLEAAGGGLRLGDVASTLQSGRRALPVRQADVATTIDEAICKLRKPQASRPTRASKREPRVAFMFPGQGAQYIGMGSELYTRLPVFRDAIDRCAEILVPLAGSDLRAQLYPPQLPDGSDDAARATTFAQPALFAIEYALARVWTSWGIAPVAMIGHSVGEFVAACLAGVMRLEDALALVHRRAALMAALPNGAMLTVRQSETELAPYLNGTIQLAAANAPALSVVSGSLKAIAALETTLNERGIINRRLHTSHAFHSAMMDSIVAPLTAQAEQFDLAAPAIPYVSTVTGDWITPDDASSPDYWGRHSREPVRFGDALATLVGGGITTLIEVGPGAALSTFALAGAAKEPAGLIVRSLPGADREQGDLATLLDSAGRLWSAGASLDFGAVRGNVSPTRVALPTYPFERKRFWIEPPLRAGEAVHAAADATPSEEEIGDDTDRRAAGAPSSNGSRVGRIRGELIALFEEISGEDLTGAAPESTFIELGFDSLLLGRVVQHIQTKFGATVAFRQLLSDVTTFDALSSLVDAQAPPDAAIAPVVSTPAAASPAVAAPSASALEAVVREQLGAMQQLMQEQLRAFERLRETGDAVPATAPVASVAPERFDAFRIVTDNATSDLSAAQHAHIKELVARANARYAESKRLTQLHRPTLADPRVAAGFRAEWKEMVYPISCVRAKGSRLWDVDGNEYIDLLNGFGQTAFGHSPDFVVDAVQTQLSDGFAIGPQTDLAGQAAQMLCELTGNERATFCNTGSEAVMAALRIARAVTGRTKVVAFEGAYHGQFDEVLVKRAGTGRTMPIASGIPGESVANMIVLPFGTDETREWIREHAGELAAVITEPVQSRRPGFVPTAFLTEVRAITERAGTALIFDEVVTGFRVDPGGMQAVMGIRADLVTYGKVVGGGLPIGILAGKAKFMDALDGGMWNYGDDSFPQVAPTFFAGTFVRHPLAMAAVVSVLHHIKAEGPQMQAALSARATRLVERINAELARCSVSKRIDNFGSIFYVDLHKEDRFASLLFYHLRNRGVYIQEGFPCFLTTAHTDADVDAIVTAFAQSLDELRAHGIFADAPAGALTVPAIVEVAPTEPQREIWLAAQLGDDASCAFNESVTLRLRGALDETAFEEAWRRIVARHESLRATFSHTGETMRIARDVDVPLRRVDLRDRPENEAEAILAERIDTDARTPFDLVAGPLVRGQLVRLATNTTAFVMTAHHIVCDGYSVNVVLDELATAYAAVRRGETLALPAPLAFSAYARQKAAPQAQSRAAVETYWREQFAEPVTALELPADRARPAVKTFRGATRSAFIDRRTRATIRDLGKRNGSTLFVTLATAFHTLIGRLADRDDVVVGVPVAGQAFLNEGDILVGHCVHFLPVRAKWSGDTSIAELLGEVKDRVFGAYEHQDYTLGTLVRDLGLRRDVNRIPLAEVQFNVERLAGGVRLPDLEADVVPNAKAFVNFDLFLNVVDSDDGLRLDCDYSTDLFDAATIDRWLEFYRTLLLEMAADATQSVSAVAYIAPSERGALRAGLATPPVAHSFATVHALIEAQIAQRSAKIAVRFRGKSLSYAELDARANRLARYLLARTGGSGALVGVCLERSLEVVVALLATHKAGCAYVPLDPSHPQARLRRILSEAGVAALITDDSAGASLIAPGVPLIDVLSDGDTIRAESALPLDTAVAADDLAYVIYTSGSTGVPKGVEITHGAVVNLLSAMANEPGLTENDTFLAVTTVAFDIAGLELFLPLSVGATLTIAPADETSDGFRLLVMIADATAMQATPATWRLLLEGGFVSAPGFVMLCGGEALPRELADRLLAGGGTLWNMYGPTETTIWSSCSRVLPGDAPITVGRPIANTTFYVLDHHDQLVPVGATGQLHIGGAGVARGYFKRPELTAERFIDNPFGAGRIYRTGDSARVRADGTVQLFGRLDNQVKVRGFRIELGEIEAALERSGGLAAAVVTVREDVSGDQKLVAYYVARAGSPRTPETLRSALADELPRYMIPSLWVALDALPLSPSGKVDRAALPAPESAAPPSSPAAAQSPQTATETALARIWREVLHLDRISVDDDLFALGADSLQLFAITARANEQNIRLSAKELFRYPSIGALARRLDERVAS